MKNKIYLLSFFLVVLVMQNGYSQDDRWRYITADDEYSVYLDTRTVSKSNPDLEKKRIEIWTKWNCLKDCYSSSGVTTLEFAMIRIEIDCNDRLWRELERTDYFIDQSTDS